MRGEIGDFEENKKHEYKITEKNNDDGMFLGDEYRCIYCDTVHLCTQRKHTGPTCTHSEEFYAFCSSE